MKAGLCKDCKHWDTPHFRLRHLRHCQAMECLDYISEQSAADTKAVLTEYSSLATAEDFGCVLWEAKP